MADPVLNREVDLPRPRSSGAAIVAVASLAMFTAVGASAFVVRVRARMPIHRPDRPVAAAYEQLPGGAECKRSRAKSRAVREHFLDAVRAGDRPTALRIFNHQMDPGMAGEFASLREEVARTHIESEVLQIAADSDAGRCDQAQQRLDELRELVPEHEVFTPTGACAKPVLRSVPVRLVP